MPTKTMEPTSAQRELFKKLGIRQEPQRELLDEVRQLRTELAELRAELQPVPSLILTGRDVVEAFKLIHKQG